MTLLDIVLLSTPTLAEPERQKWLISQWRSLLAQQYIPTVHLTALIPFLGANGVNTVLDRHGKELLVSDLDKIDEAYLKAFPSVIYEEVNETRQRYDFCFCFSFLQQQFLTIVSCLFLTSDEERAAMLKRIDELKAKEVQSQSHIFANENDRSQVSTEDNIAQRTRSRKRKKK